MPDELYEAGQRVKFAARMDGRYTDLNYLIRLCSNEVFQKQKGSQPKRTPSSVHRPWGVMTSICSQHAVELTHSNCGAATAVRTRRAVLRSSASARSGAPSARTRTTPASAIPTTTIRRRLRST
eukprot:581368-Prymnesium_polylepis.3